MHDIVRWQHHPLMAFMPGWSALGIALLGDAQEVHDPLALYWAILPSCHERRWYCLRGGTIW
jgi:hypothetical protein